MNTLILKLNATGDVVRTTTLMRRIEGHITWITAPINVELLNGSLNRLRCLSWDSRASALDRHYDLVINLEDDREAAAFARQVGHAARYGAYLDNDGSVAYTEDSRQWFDLSLISAHGRERADELKLLNRRTYQDLIFSGLGHRFRGEQYVLPEPVQTGLRGDVAIAPVAGPVWPMKGWAFYEQLGERLEAEGITTNVLPRRASLLEHMGDVVNHRCLVSGDSLPMHFALGTGTRCVTLFNCTSPWEIYDYGIQIKIASPLLDEFFYKRGRDSRAMTAISLEDVYSAILKQLNQPANLPVQEAL